MLSCTHINALCSYSPPTVMLPHHAPSLPPNSSLLPFKGFCCGGIYFMCKSEKERELSSLFFPPLYGS